MKKEADVKEVVKDVLKKTAECWWFMPPANGYGRSGIPDFIGCVSGRFFAVETKFGSNSTTALQKRELAGISNASGQSWVVTDKNIDQWIGDFSNWVKSC